MSVKISLDKGWFLLSDKNQWILAQQRGDRLIQNYFYGNLENALTGIIDHKLKLSDVGSIEEIRQQLLDALTSVHRAILENKEVFHEA